MGVFKTSLCLKVTFVNDHLQHLSNYTLASVTRHSRPRPDTLHLQSLEGSVIVLRQTKNTKQKERITWCYGTPCLSDFVAGSKAKLHMDDIPRLGLQQ